MNKEVEFYNCIPEIHEGCNKKNCCINGGECKNTVIKKYSVEGVLEEIQNLYKEKEQLYIKTKMLENENRRLKLKLKKQKEENK